MSVIFFYFLYLTFLGKILFHFNSPSFFFHPRHEDRPQCHEHLHWQEHHSLEQRHYPVCHLVLRHAVHSHWYHPDHLPRSHYCSSTQGLLRASDNRWSAFQHNTSGSTLWNESVCLRWHCHRWRHQPNPDQLLSIGKSWHHGHGLDDNTSTLQLCSYVCLLHGGIAFLFVQETPTVAETSRYLIKACCYPWNTMYIFKHFHKQLLYLSL